MVGSLGTEQFEGARQETHFFSPSAAKRTKLAVVISSSGPELNALVRMMVARGKSIGAEVRFAHAKQLDPIGLAETLSEMLREGIDGLAFQALDHPAVRDVASEALARGVSVASLLSPLDGLGGSHYIGLDNRAAGRTAGLLMGNIVRNPGTIAVLWSGHLFRAHELRESGFRTVMRSDFEALGLLQHVTGYDDAKRNYRQILKFLDECPDLTGIYSVGGGHSGIVDALRERGRSGQVKLIVHNLTPNTRRLLISGAINIVIHQDMNAIAAKALEALTSGSRHAHTMQHFVPIEIITKENVEDRGLSPELFSLL